MNHPGPGHSPGGDPLRVRGTIPPPDAGHHRNVLPLLSIGLLVEQPGFSGGLLVAQRTPAFKTVAAQLFRLHFNENDLRTPVDQYAKRKDWRQEPGYTGFSSSAIAQISNSAHRAGCGGSCEEFCISRSQSQPGIVKI